MLNNNITLDLMIFFRRVYNMSDNNIILYSLISIVRLPWTPNCWLGTWVERFLKKKAHQASCAKLFEDPEKSGRRKQILNVFTLGPERMSSLIFFKAINEKMTK